MIKFNKRGIIILSQYRSGGTQLKQILVRAAEYKGLQSKDRGEVDVNTSNTKFKDELYNKFFTNLDEFKVILLNNPVVVSNLCSTNLIERLNEEFEIIHLERKDAAKCLLSLPLWERFIKKGLFKADKPITNNLRKWSVLTEQQENLKPIKDNLFRIYSGYNNKPLDVYKKEQE